MCGPISRWNRRTALSVHCSLYWFVRRWCLTRKRIVWRSSRANANRCATLSNMRAPTSAWPWKCTPSGVNVRVGTLPMSCSSAAQRTSGRRTVCSHDLLGVRPDVLVLAAGLLDEVDRRLELGEQHAQDAAPACSHSSAASTSRPISICSIAAAQARLVGVREPRRRARARRAVTRRAACGPRSAIAPAISTSTTGSASTSAAHAVGCRHGRRTSGRARLPRPSVPARLVRTVLQARRTCKVVSQKRQLPDGRASRCPASRGSTTSSTRSPRRSSTFCGRSRAASVALHDVAEASPPLARFPRRRVRTLWQVGLPACDSAVAIRKRLWGKIDDDDEASPDRCLRLGRRRAHRRAGASSSAARRGHRLPRRHGARALRQARARAPSRSTRWPASGSCSTAA